MFQYGRSTYPFINLGPQFIRIDRGQEIKFSRNSPEEKVGEQILGRLFN
jgi:hypothetical protein